MFLLHKTLPVLLVPEGSHLCKTRLRASSGSSDVFFSGTQQGADRLKLFTLNRKHWLSVAGWIWALSESVNIYSLQVMTLQSTTKTYAIESGLFPDHQAPVICTGPPLPLLVGTAHVFLFCYIMNGISVLVNLCHYCVLHVSVTQSVPWSEVCFELNATEFKSCQSARAA